MIEKRKRRKSVRICFRNERKRSLASFFPLIAFHSLLIGGALSLFSIAERGRFPRSVKRNANSPISSTRRIKRSGEEGERERIRSSFPPGKHPSPALSSFPFRVSYENFPLAFIPLGCATEPDSQDLDDFCPSSFQSVRLDGKEGKGGEAWRRY